MNRLRVAVFVPSPFLGGVAMCMMNYFRHSDPERFAMDFFVKEAPPRAFADEIDARGGRVTVVPGFRNPLKYVRTVAALLKDGRYDVVHANMNTLSAFPLCAAGLARIPVRIAHSHVNSSWHEPVRHVAKLLLRPWANLFANRYLACSELAGRWQFGDRAFDSGRVTVLKNAIDLSRFSFDAAKRDEFRRKYGLEGGAVLGFVGRLVKQKNPLKLLSLFAAVAHEHPDARLLIVGEGPLGEGLRAAVERLGLSSRVVFAGRQEDPAPFYSAMDVFVFPSRYEGLGMTLVEAQVNGLPCVASDRVPDEADVTDTVTFVPVDAPDGIWAGHVRRAMDRGRLDAGAMDRIRNAGYDITREAGRLATVYGCR